MTEEEQRLLTQFYFKILSSSNKFCVQEFNSSFEKNTGNAFEPYIQTAKGATNAPTVSDNTITL
jgi:hypothetical protein